LGLCPDWRRRLEKNPVITLVVDNQEESVSTHSTIKRERLLMMLRMIFF